MRAGASYTVLTGLLLDQEGRHADAAQCPSNCAGLPSAWSLPNPTYREAIEKPSRASCPSKQVTTILRSQRICFPEWGPEANGKVEKVSIGPG